LVHDSKSKYNTTFFVDYCENAFLTVNAEFYCIADECPHSDF